MGSTEIERAIRARQRTLSRSIGVQYRTIRQDVGLSIRAVGHEAGLDPSHVLRVEIGDRDASLDAMVAMATVLGHDVSLRLYPTTGPRVRDHIQVRMVEVLLAILHPRWHARLEVPVYRPVRGVIDVVLVDPGASELVAGEGHSQLRSFEHQLRWAAEKADALPSAEGFPWVDTVAAPPVGRLLLLRSTAATRELARSLPVSFRAAYPGSSREAYEALTSATTRWPGAAIVWVDVQGAQTRVIHGPPRGVRT